MLTPNPRGNFHFLKGIAAYSSGVVADAGYEIAHATLRASIPMRVGLELIAQHLKHISRPMQALCAIELRSPRQFTFESFAQFNNDIYRALLDEHDLLVDGINPLARTNVVPQLNPPSEPSLYALSYTIPAPESTGPRDFVVAGAGELIDDSLNRQAIVRQGDNSDGAMREKAAYVLSRMSLRLQGLDVEWNQVRVVNIYTTNDIFSFLRDEVLAKVGAASAFGVHWHFTRPPIVGLEYEMDVRGVKQEIFL